MRALLAACIVLAAPAATACEGDLHGYWEVRPADTNEFYEVVAEFRIDSETGMLSDCPDGPARASGYGRDDLSMSFLYGGEVRTVYDNGDGSFLSLPYEAMRDSSLTEFRFRIER